MEEIRMKKVLIIFTTFIALFTLSACHDDSMDANKMGSKIEKKYLEKNSYGIWEDKDNSSVQYSVNDKDKIVGIEFNYKQGYKSVSSKAAMANYRSKTADDLKWIKDDLYYSKSKKQYYRISENIDSDGKVSHASIFFNH